MPHFGLLAALVCALSLGSVGAAQQEVPGQPGAQPPSVLVPERVVMVRLGDEEIAVEDYMRYISQDARLVRQALSGEGRRAVVRAMVSDLLLQREMRDQGLVEAKPGEAITGEVFGRAMAELAGRHWPAPDEIDEADLKAYYDVNIADYGMPPTFRLSQIQLRFAFVEGEDVSEEERAAVRVRAENALARIEAGESFETVAGEVTDNERGRVAGGDLGFLREGQSAWLDSVVGELAPGEMTGVIESPVGFEILRVTERRESVIMPYANVRELVVQHYTRKKQLEARDAFVRELAAQADDLEFLEPGLEGLFD